MLFSQAVQTALAEGADKLASTETLCDSVLPHTSPSGSDRIHKEMQILKEELASLGTICSDAADDLQGALQEIKEYTTEQATFVEWLDSAENKVKVTSETFQFQAPEQQEIEFEVRSWRLCVKYIAFNYAHIRS